VHKQPHGLVQRQGNQVVNLHIMDTCAL
jgi:hypothetical protein